MRKSALQSGQALLIILLVMAVGLTIALSIVSRSVTDIRISQEEEESARAFSAAEAGIEESLKLGSAATTVSFEGIDVQVTGTDRGGGPNFVFDEPAVEGETQTLWLIGHDTDGGLIESPFYTQNVLEVCWQETDPETALEVAIFYKDAADGNYKVARGAYDSEAVSRGNNFSSPDAGNCSGLDQFERRKSLNLGDFGITPATDTLIALRLRPLYNQTEIGVVGTGGDPGGLIPTQGKCYESTATTETGVSRKVRQCQSYPAPPAIFDYVLFSGGDIETAP